MRASVLLLRTLQPDDEAGFMEALQDFHNKGDGNFAPGFTEAMTFSEYVLKNEQWSRGETLLPGFVAADFYVGVVDGVIVGRLALRHELNDFLSRVGGHIGYAVRPAYRKRGYATSMLRQSLPLAAALGLKRVLLTCNDDNFASRTVIERCGGVLEDITAEPDLTVQKRRYWIPTTSLI